jgi:uncharacterized protein YjhX (UPF0386 family)
MNISRKEQHALHVLAPGGRILHERENGPGITSGMCVTREGMILSDVVMTVFNKLRRKRLIGPVASCPCGTARGSEAP